MTYWERFGRILFLIKRYGHLPGFFSLAFIVQCYLVEHNTAHTVKCGSNFEFTHTHAHTCTSADLQYKSSPRGEYDACCMYFGKILHVNSTSTYSIQGTNWRISLFAKVIIAAPYWSCVESACRKVIRIDILCHSPILRFHTGSWSPSTIDTKTSQSCNLWYYCWQLTLQWASCKIRKISGCACAGNPGMFSPPLRVNDPDMHHGTCVTHVSWCMPGSLTSGFLGSRWRGKRSRHSRCMHNPLLEYKEPYTDRVNTESSNKTLIYYATSHIKLPRWSVNSQTSQVRHNSLAFC